MFRRWFRADSRKQARRTPPKRRRFESLEDRRLLAVFSVTSVNEFGTGSLREAILQANASPGLDTIDFNIAGAGVQTLSLLSDLPDITDAVIIDGYTQAGASANTQATGNNAVILIEVANAGISVGAAHGFKVVAGGEGTEIRGLSLSNFTNAGIIVETDDVTIDGNFIGLRADGTADGNGVGILVTQGNNIAIGGATPAARNVISGNANDGIAFDGVSVSFTNTKVEGNYIGVNPAGFAAIANGGAGISLSDTVGATIGGVATGARNVISGNSGDGIDLLGPGVSNTLIQGNFIGVDASGGAAISNGDTGVYIFNSSGNIIGGAGAARNIISGNGLNGIGIEGLGATGNQIFGNFIGLNAGGDGAIGNLANGVGILDSPGTIIGSSMSAPNFIAGNSENGIGIQGADAEIVNNIQGADAEIVNNQIGVLFDGLTPLGNLANGIGIVNGASITISQNGIFASGLNGIGIAFSQSIEITENSIGGDLGLENAVHGIGLFDTSDTTIGFANTIFGNSGAGVAIGGMGTGNTITGNSIFGNGELGIDLTPSMVTDGVTPNDNLDADSGANNFQNFPVIDSVEVTGLLTRIVGTLNSTPGSTFLLEFFFSDEVDPSGFGEGDQIVGDVIVNTDGNGIATFDVSLTPEVSGAFYTATATNLTTGDTSEFSLAVAPSTPPPTPTVSIAAAAITEGDAGTQLLTFTVALDFATDEPTSVNFATSDLTATAGIDYVAAIGTVNFAAGETIQTFDVIINGDIDFETDETFLVTLSNFVGLNPGDITAVGTILNDDVAVGPIPGISVTDVTAFEGNSGTVPFIFEITLSFASASVVTVQFETVSVSAVANTDYVPIAGTATFNPGETSVFVAVTVISDTIPEINETFNLVLSAPSNATIVDGVGVGVILNDDQGGSVPAPRTDRAVQFVKELYLDILGREGDPAGVLYWSGIVLDGRDRASVARAIIESDEYRGRLVDRMYDEFLGRDPVESERNLLVAGLRTGAREEDIMAFILGSDEYLFRHSEASRDFLDGLYQDLFGRTADAAGREYWEGQLEGGMSRQQVARAFAASREFQIFLLDDPDELFTTVERDWYRDYFGRAIDPSGREFWSNALSNGATWRDVQVSILGSDEYFTRADGVDS